MAIAEQDKNTDTTDWSPEVDVDRPSEAATVRSSTEMEEGEEKLPEVPTRRFSLEECMELALMASQEESSKVLEETVLTDSMISLMRNPAALDIQFGEVAFDELLQCSDRTFGAETVITSLCGSQSNGSFVEKSPENCETKPTLTQTNSESLEVIETVSRSAGDSDVKTVAKVVGAPQVKNEAKEKEVKQATRETNLNKETRGKKGPNMKKETKETEVKETTEEKQTRETEEKRGMKDMRENELKVFKETAEVGAKKEVKGTRETAVKIETKEKTEEKKERKDGKKETQVKKVEEAEWTQVPMSRRGRREVSAAPTAPAVLPKKQPPMDTLTVAKQKTISKKSESVTINPELKIRPEIVTKSKKPTSQKPEPATKNPESDRIQNKKVSKRKKKEAAHSELSGSPAVCETIQNVANKTNSGKKGKRSDAVTVSGLAAISSKFLEIEDLSSCGSILPPLADVRQLFFQDKEVEIIELKSDNKASDCDIVEGGKMNRKNLGKDDGLSATQKETKKPDCSTLCIKQEEGVSIFMTFKIRVFSPMIF